jgi:DNA invertase Pin-like site-specific DNA recombinase
MRQMAGVFAELEKRMLVKRLTDGRRANRDAGKFAAFGSPVYGKRSAGRGVLVDDDREQVGLDRIRQLHAAGTSLRGMVEVLEAEGHAPKRGGRWHPQTLARVVARL